MSAKLDNYSNTAPNWGWLVSGHISQTPILKNAASVLLVTFMTNGKKATVENQDDGYKAMTLREIAELEGVSHQYILEILNKAMKKIRKKLKEKGIEKDDLL